ncbi:16S rRNA (uracil(1498)-N(3))-methyltransferase [Brasilonema sp. UFV-L1]|uniref:16S rRNA (uracil(1498)-N(3))-methyltransferase n=1 Tax=Brasilonema sp. UFV-L1 TaxID=2234130 RepID=UPI00145D498C|nr:16S rRNA (uracil(1498)-N(3))-methyltransferase [Brasilonema sp. UFV-L1]NMG07074.1 16S rRNA (uracil(1498)-N(3))-methyltransferase [Brasilonema sp. UFV-L1]
MSQLQRISLVPSQLQQEQILLTPQQQHYLGRVLRLREGDHFIAMDGKGKWWLAQLQGEKAQILESLTVETELPVSITLMVALPKGNGFDDVVRVCTELGVAVIAPVVSDRTLLHPSPQKLERWLRIAQEAAEQSERAFVPTILEPVSFITALATGTTSHRYICEARGNYAHLREVINQVSTTSEMIIATGPEGGWTQKEVECAIDAGFQPVSLGRRILRAVTAPIVALSIVAAQLESVSLN